MSNGYRDAHSTEAGYDSLACGIIAQAVVDYRSALKGKTRRYSAGAENVIRECEMFFRSGFFTSLTEVSGEYMIRMIREETKE
jgi:hypothetical protein